jgi:hypothetical protein
VNWVEASLKDNFLILSGDMVVVYELTSGDDFKLVKEYKGNPNSYQISLPNRSLA